MRNPFKPHRRNTPGTRLPPTLAEQVRDAQRVVAGWSEEKRQFVKLEGGVVDPCLYRVKGETVQCSFCGSPVTPGARCHTCETIAPAGVLGTLPDQPKGAA